MGNILIVDDLAFWRDIVSDLMRSLSHTVVTAMDGSEAMASLKAWAIDLVILDVGMPSISGLSFLEQIRREARWKDLPVIMLTGDMLKEHVLLAKKLGISDYLLKSRFNPDELSERVRTRLESAKPPVKARPAAHTTIHQPALTAPPVAESTDLENTPPLLTRAKCLARAAHAMSGRTLRGVVAEVITSASSPWINLPEMAMLVGRDSILTARVLQAANSAANVSAKGRISTLADAVRILGYTNIRDIAASVGIFDVMPKPDSDGFDPIRCWQHSLAVATLCERLAPTEMKGLAYVVGLCHDLGQILFRSHFGVEYRQVLALQQATKQPLHRVELQLLGATRGEISKEILGYLDLAESITRPINAFHQAVRTNAAPMEPLAQVLQLADAYASGCLLASSPEADVRAFTHSECHECTGQDNPPRPDDLQFRSDIFSLTSVYARIPAGDQRSLSQPLFFKQDARVFVIRDPALSTFDPVTAALQSMAEVTIGKEFPSGAERDTYQMVVGIARSTNVPGMTANDFIVAEGGNIEAGPGMLLIAGTNEVNAPTLGRVSVALWPVSIAKLAAFVQADC